jgi:hypothetical protein
VSRDRRPIGHKRAQIAVMRRADPYGSVRARVETSRFAGHSSMEPTGIEPVTSCLQIEAESLWESADLEDFYL